MIVTSTKSDSFYRIEALKTALALQTSGGAIYANTGTKELLKSAKSIYKFIKGKEEVQDGGVDLGQ